MAGIKGEDGKIRISIKALIALAVVFALAVAGLVVVVPRYGRILSAYRSEHQAYTAAQMDLSDAKDDNKELTRKHDELTAVTEEANAVRDEVYAMISQLEQDILEGKTDKKICYITIDDGPYKRGNEYLEIFNKYDIKATFFLTTANGDKLPDQADETARSMYPEYVKYGHTIGNHSYSHNYGEGGIYKSAKSFLKSVEKQTKFTAEATGGYKPQIVRFPGGTGMAGADLESYEQALREAGYGWIDWTLDSGDSWGADRSSPEQIRDNVISAADDEDQKIMVVLFHEWSKNTVEVLPEIIEKLQEKGYVFLPLFYDSVMVKK